MERAEPLQQRVPTRADEDDDWFFTFFQPYRYVINRVPVYPSIGNHDAAESEECDDRAQVEDNFYLVERLSGEEAAGRASFKPGLFYRTRFGSDIEFVCIDTSKEAFFGRRRLFEFPKHWAFLEASFPPDGGERMWRIPFAHHPPYSAGPLHHNTRSMARLIPLWQRACVRVMFSGHEHNFQHSRADGIDYLVTGAAGKFRGGTPDELAGAHTQSWSAAVPLPAGAHRRRSHADSCHRGTCAGCHRIDRHHAPHAARRARDVAHRHRSSPKRVGSAMGGEQAMPITSGHDHEAIVIGAGVAGIYQIKRLVDLGIDATVLDAAPDLGGTWYWNRYPGARFDSESYTYGYSFSRELLDEWHWKERFSSQPENLRYLNYVADKFDLRRHMRFDCKVESMRWDDAGNVWRLDLGGGETATCRYAILAVGLLSVPTMPRYQGMDRFRGKSFHTFHWPHEGVELAGKRVGVIGTGATAIQVIAEIADQVGELYVFQRRPNWSAPLNNGPISDAEMAQIRARYDEIFARATQHPAASSTNPTVADSGR